MRARPTHLHIWIEILRRSQHLGDFQMAVRHGPVERQSAVVVDSLSELGVGLSRYNTSFSSSLFLSYDGTPPSIHQEWGMEVSSYA